MKTLSNSSALYLQAGMGTYKALFHNCLYGILILLLVLQWFLHTHAG